MFFPSLIDAPISSTEEEVSSTAISAPLDIFEWSWPLGDLGDNSVKSSVAFSSLCVLDAISSAVA